MDGLSKLDELRVKTDHELWQLLNDDLDQGLAGAREALNTGDLTSARQSYFKARRAYTEVLRLLPVAYELTAAQRNELESRLNELHRILDQLAGLESLRGPHVINSGSNRTNDDLRFIDPNRVETFPRGHLARSSG